MSKNKDKHKYHLTRKELLIIQGFTRDALKDISFIFKLYNEDEWEDEYLLKLINYLMDKYELIIDTAKTSFEEASLKQLNRMSVDMINSIEEKDEKDGIDKDMLRDFKEMKENTDKYNK